MKLTSKGSIISLVFFSTFAVLLFYNWNAKQKHSVLRREREAAVNYYQICTQWLEAAKIATHSHFFTTSVLGQGPEWKDLAAINELVHEYRWNMCPTVVELIRSRSDPEELYRLDRLLEFVSSLSMRRRHQPGELGYNITAFKAEVNSVKPQFLQDWDSGAFNSSDHRISTIIPTLQAQFLKAGHLDRRIYEPLLHYGIFALPPVIKKIGETNSAIIFGSFLTLSQHPEARGFYPRFGSVYPSSNEQIALIRNWWASEHIKFNKLHPLYEKIDAAVKALPRVEEQTNSVAAAASP